jgi:apolipoprotein N-acyltransferase
VNDNGPKLKTFTFRSTLLAILSGLMLTASFPPGKFSFMAWFALVPLLICVDRASPSQAFRLGFVAGAVHFTTLMYWIVMVLGHYGNMSIIVSLGPFFLLCFFLALYPALFSAITTCLRHSRITVILMASFWVSLEYIRGVFLTGLPWCLLGYSQYEHLHLIQISDITGVYGISFLIVVSNGLIYSLLFRGREKVGGSLKWDILFTVLLVTVTVFYGRFRLSQGLPGGDSPNVLRTAIIQPNIDQSVKWNPAYQAKTLSIFERLTRSSYAFKPELIVWPEAALPFFFQQDVKFAPKVFLITEESGAVLIFGSPAYKRAESITKYYNRAYLITHENIPPQYYDKIHLVPFGEYVPFKNLLSFINRLVPAAGDFASGLAKGPMTHGELSAGVIICFEAIFPGLARAHARGGANILVNITNDAWFGMSSAPHQHLGMAVFRAVENRRPLVRAANTGISAFIDAKGKIVSRSSLFTEEVLKDSVNISKAPLTFYARFGDLFTFLLLAFCSVKLLFVFCHGRTAKP